jgi:putative endonuclease
MVASGPYGHLYVGVTNDLIRRIDEHRHGQVDGYTREHGCDQLVWYEEHAYIDQAILREKRIKTLAPRLECPARRETQRMLDLYSTPPG